MKINLTFIILLIATTISCQEQDKSEILLNELRGKIGEEKYPNIDAIIVEFEDKIIVEGKEGRNEP